jgi:Tfp pilus assembly protein PilF
VKNEEREQEVHGAPHGRTRPWLTLAAILMVAAIPYLNALGNGFVYDDHQQILINPYLRSFHYLRAIFTTSVWSFLGGAAGVTNYYRPLMMFGYLLCFKLFGPSAFAFHLVNLLMHLAVVLLVYQVTVSFFRDRDIAALAALIFALHPIHTESVDWIAAVTDIEVALFFLAGFWFYLRIPRLVSSRPNRRWGGAQAALLVCLALALLSKEQAVMLPVLCTIFEHFYREDRSGTSLGEKVARYAPGWLLVGIYLLVRVRFLGSLAPAHLVRPGVTIQDAVLSAGALLFQYVGKMLWPARLCAYYVFPVSWAVLLPQVLGGIVTVLAGAALFALCWRRARLVSFGVVWFVVTLVPVLDVRVMPIAAFAERYLYLPSVGFCWILAWAALGLWRLADARGRTWRVAVASAGALLAVLAIVRTVIRNRDWHDDLRFYRSALAVSPDAYVMHTDLGKLYWDMGQKQLAGQEWRAALKIQPEEPVVLSNMGLLLTSEHRYDEAVDDLKRALETAPEDTGSHIDLGMAYDEMGRRDDAEREFQTAIRLSPLSIFAHNQLGQLYFDEERFTEADRQFQASVALGPNLGAWFGLGLSRWRQGDAAGAEGDFKNAEKISPGDARVHFMLALLYGADRRYPEAFAEYQKGFKIEPDNQTALDAFHRLQEEFSNASSASPAGEAAHHAP